MGEESVRFIHNITKEYPQMIKVVIYKEPVIFPNVNGRKRNKREVKNEDYTPDITSLKRTKTLIKDIIICNNFELFCTFTFDPKKIDRFNYYRCRYAMSVWLHHQKDKSPDFKYLVVPEQHKSGAWHFHALISHYKGSLRDSKHKTSTGRLVYNITGFRSGFTSAVPIDNAEAVGAYVSKYITKDFITMFNQRRFFCSRNLIRPVKSVNSPIFRNTPPLFRKKVGEGKDTETFLLPLPSF